MPNWCDNRITISASDDKSIKKLVEIYEFIDRTHRKEAEDLLAAKAPYARINDEGLLNHICPHETNEENWYNNNISNWGTKWDIRGCDIDYYYLNPEQNQLVISFQSAWSPPIEAFASFKDKMNELGIRLSIYMIFEEQGEDFIGYWIDGSTGTRSTTALYEALAKNDPDALAFARMCDTDIEVLGEAYFCLSLIEGDDSCECALCKMQKNDE
jgi:hypothetical protein